MSSNLERLQTLQKAEIVKRIDDAVAEAGFPGLVCDIHLMPPSSAPDLPRLYVAFDKQRNITTKEMLQDAVICDVLTSLLGAKKVDIAYPVDVQAINPRAVKVFRVWAWESVGPGDTA